jgi:hypothetical protein
MLLLILGSDAKVAINGEDDMRTSSLEAGDFAATQDFEQASQERRRPASRQRPGGVHNLWNTKNIVGNVVSADYMTEATI